MLTTRTRRGIALGVGALAVTFAAAAALAPHGSAGSSTAAVHFRVAVVNCGDTIVVNTKLANDLTGCPSNGIIVGASHVILDLGGHTITGTGNGDGVRLSGPSNAVINGTVQGFEVGVRVDGGATRGTVQGVHAIDNSFMDISSFGDDAIINANFASGGLSAIGLGLSSRAHVTNNWARAAEVGILVGPATGAVLSGNRVLSNSGPGIKLEDSVGTGTVVTANIVAANAGSGITAPAAAPVTLTRNVASNNTDLGIDVGPLAIDGGGNQGRGNGKLHQCENVVCP